MPNEIALRHIFSDLPEIETGRLRLRKLRLEDARDVFQYAGDPAVTNLTTWSTHLSINETKAFIQSVRLCYERGEVAPWGIEQRADHVLVGAIGFRQVTDGYIAELDYVLARSHRQTDLAVEAVRNVLEFGFSHLGFHRIQAVSFEDDLFSRSVHEEAGMRCEGVLRDYRYIKGRFVTVRMYAMLRREYAR